mgnify:CR=1 FL=1|tara:strand:+ start:1579 stop:1722 length:144 start_codon:yes stop_codon:yes gene_type:complete
MKKNKKRWDESDDYDEYPPIKKSAGKDAWEDNPRKKHKVKKFRYKDE